MTGTTHNGYNYWTLYYRDTKDLAMCLRSTNDASDIHQHVLRRMLNDLIKQKLIDDNIPLLRDAQIGYYEGWDMCLSFDLCPCIEIAMYALKWRWWQVTLDV